MIRHDFEKRLKAVWLREFHSSPYNQELNDAWREYRALCAKDGGKLSDDQIANAVIRRAVWNTFRAPLGQTIKIQLQSQPQKDPNKLYIGLEPKDNLFIGNVSEERERIARRIDETLAMVTGEEPTRKERERTERRKAEARRANNKELKQRYQKFIRDSPYRLAYTDENGVVHKITTRQAVAAHYGISAQRSIDLATLKDGRQKIVRQDLNAWIKGGQQPTTAEVQGVLADLKRQYPASKYDIKFNTPISDNKYYADYIPLAIKDRQTGKITLGTVYAGSKNHAIPKDLMAKAYLYKQSYPQDKIEDRGIIFYTNGPFFMQSYQLGTGKDQAPILYGHPNKAVINDDEIKLEKIHARTAKMKQLLPVATSRDPNDFINKSVIYADIEKDIKGNTTSVAGIKTLWNKTTERFEIVDIYERYYYPKYETGYGLDPDFHNVHGYTTAMIDKLRKDTGAVYSKEFNAKEQEAWKRWAGNNPTYIGYNIIGTEKDPGDLKDLLGWEGMNKAKIIDLFLIADQLLPKDPTRNTRQRQEDLVEMILGQTAEQLGYKLHISMDDAGVLVEVVSELARRKGELPDIIWHIINSETTEGIRLSERSKTKPYSRVTVGGIAIGPEEIFYISPKEYRAGVNMAKTGAGLSGVDWQQFNDFIRTVKDTVASGDDMINNLNATFGRFATHTNTLTSDLQNLSGTIGAGNRLKALQVVRSIPVGATVAEAEAILNAGGLSLYDEVNGQKVANRNYAAWQSGVAAKQRARLVKLKERVDTYEASGKISSTDAARLREIDSYKDLTEAMNGAIEKQKLLTTTYNAFAKMGLNTNNIYDHNRIYNAIGQQWNGVNRAMGTWMPDWLHAPISDFGNAAINNMRQQQAAYNFNRNSVLGALNVGMGAGAGLMATGVGTIPGVVIAGASAVGKLAYNIWGWNKEKQITQTGEGLQEMFNIWGGIKDMLLMPFRALSSVLRLFTRGLRVSLGALTAFSAGLLKIISSGLTRMQGLGNPLTNLTGVTYGGYQDYTLMDTLFGFSGGTINSGIENFTTQQRQLYLSGQYNQERLMAAARLGEFTSVYAASGNPEEHFAGLINRQATALAGEDTERRRDRMTLLGAISPEIQRMTQVLFDLRQVLGNASLTFEQLKDPSNGTTGMFYDKISENARQNYRVAGYQYGVFTNSIGNSLMRIAGVFWNSGLKDLANQFASWLADIATNANVWVPKLMEALDPIVGWIKSLGNSISKGDWDSVGDQLKNAAMNIGKVILMGIGWAAGQLKNLWEVHGKNIISTLQELAVSIYSIWDEIFYTILDKSWGFLQYLSTASIDFTKFHFDKSTGKISFDEGFFTIGARPGGADIKDLPSGMSYAPGWTNTELNNLKAAKTADEYFDILGRVVEHGLDADISLFGHNFRVDNLATVKALRQMYNEAGGTPITNPGLAWNLFSDSLKQQLINTLEPGVINDLKQSWDMARRKAVGTPEDRSTGYMTKPYYDFAQTRNNEIIPRSVEAIGESLVSILDLIQDWGGKFVVEFIDPDGNKNRMEVNSDGTVSQSGNGRIRLRSYAFDSLTEAAAARSAVSGTR